MPITITDVVARDIRFPTSRERYRLGCDESRSGLLGRVCRAEDLRCTAWKGHGLTFTIGRGNELCVAAVEALKPLVVGKTLESFTADMGAFWRMITGDSQLRWVGPEKGVIHLATAAVVNAVWDLWAKAEGKPVWRLLCDMTPEEIVRCIDFRYITDALTPDEALAILRDNAPTRAQRASRRWSATAIPRTRPRPDGSATRTSNCAISAGTRSPRAGRTSRSRSARISRTTFAAARSFARRSATAS